MRSDSRKFYRLLAALIVAVAAAGVTHIDALRGAPALPAAFVAPATSAAALSFDAAEAPPDAATALKVHYNGTPCGSATFTVKVGNTVAGTFTPAYSCGCFYAAPQSFTFTDPAVLALLSSPTCTNISVTQANVSAYTSWIAFEIVRASGSEKVCLLDGANTNCTTTSSCSALQNRQNQTWSTNQPDLDSDGTIDSCDTDTDGDGIANASDNCPTIANPDQADTDGNQTGNACQPQLAAVPWLGSTSLAHQVYSGGSLTLQAVALSTAGQPLPLASATWDPGDGSSPVAVSALNSAALELTHVYIGANNQPFTATVSATDVNGNVYTDTFKVVIAPNSRDTKVNMAIDHGLWNLHKRMNRTTSDGQPSAYWTGYGHYHVAATASVVQAFEINNHRESGNAAEDPYVADVARGLRYILSEQHGILLRMDTPSQNGHVTDNNANGYGLVVYPTDHSSYITGQVMDAIVASGTPDKTAETGQTTYVRGRKYKDLIQDLLDGYSWGMADDTGGWHYQYQGITGNNDTSASHWWAIGVLAAEQWGLDAPAWVKTIQRTVGIPRMQDLNNPSDTSRYGRFGYTNDSNPIWDDGTNVTAAGLILMNADDMAQTDPRFVAAAAYLNARYTSSNGNLYTMYQLTKAMRTALDATGATAPITLLNGTTDWYAGYADRLIANQNAAGAFTSVGGEATYYIIGDLASSWALIILTPSLFSLPPTAACTANPAELGTHGGTVTFSAAGSSHPDPDETIVSYSWNFADGSPAASGVSVAHDFTQPATFPTTRGVQVTVTDSQGLSSTATCPVTIVDTDVTPNAVAGGPYSICIGQPVTLDGSASTDDGVIVSYAWDLVAPINFTAVDATGAVVTLTPAQLAALGLGVGTHDIGLRVTDDFPKVGSAFTTLTIKAITDPSCNQPPAALDDTATTFSGTPVTIAVLSNDSDPNAGDTLAVTGTSDGPSNGGAVVNVSGTITYTPNLGFAGTDTFQYAIDDGHGATDTALVTITVNKRLATVTAGSGTKVYGAADPVLAPTSSGFLAGDGIVVVMTARDPGENVGTYGTHASASGAELANYAVTYTNGTLTITPATPVAVATGGTFTYDGEPHGGACTVTGVGNDALTGTIGYDPGPGGPVAAGTYTVTCDYAATQNYAAASATATMTIDRAAATVTAGSGTKVFGTADPTLTPTATGFLAADGVVVSNAPRDPGEDVAVYATHASASGGALGNYAVSYVDGTLEITKAAATAVATGGTLTYDGQAHPGTCTVTGVNNDVLDGTIGYTPGPGAPVAAGTYTVTCDFAGNSNYQPASGTATITINALTATVTAGSGSKVYGAADPVLTPTSTGFLPSDAIAVTQTARDTGENVGSYATHATATGAALGNYDVTYTDGTLAISPALLTVTANNVSRHYGTPNPPLTVSYTGFVFGQNESVLGGALLVTTDAAQNSPVGTYAIVPSGLTSPNYAIAFADGTLTVTNEAPVCTAAAPSVSVIWPPNHQWVPVALNGATDADADALTIAVVSIFQDEAVGSGGSGNTGPDGQGVGTSTAQVRAERAGDPKQPGDGRVYHITFSATDAAGGSCTATVQVSVPHDQSARSQPAVDGGALFDSTIAVPRR
jgi:hypothetical protein